MRTIDSKTDLVDPVPIQSPCQPLFISKVKTHHQRLLWATALDPAIPCRIITDDILSFALNQRKTHPAYGGGSKGRRRSEADGGDGTGELHGGGVLAPMLGGSLSTGGKREAVFVGCAEKWDQKHVLVAVGRAFFLMSFPITKLLVYTFVWFVFYGVVIV